MFVKTFYRNLVIFLLFSTAAFADNLHFYNPENNIDNFVILKKEFDRYLNKFNIVFVPFFQETDFLQSTASTKLLLMPSKLARQVSGFRATLVSTVNSSSTYKKVLVRKKDSTTVSKTASASGKESSVLTLQSLGIKSTVLTVPKDIDALMSVAFGIADMALAANSSLETLRETNFSMYSSLTVVSEIDNLLLPIVMVAGSTDSIKVLQNMDKDPEGVACLHLLGIDSFRPLTDSDREKL